MKQYIEQTEEGIKCNHPKVKKCWQYGGGPAGGPFQDNLLIQMLDGYEYKFTNNPDKSHIQQCNELLNVLPDILHAGRDQLTPTAAEYGLVCFKIHLIEKVDNKIPFELTEMKFELEGKLKSILYA